ncbi:MAG: nucleotidyltransferase domain-containing protein [Thermoanaerobacterales bacterium]|nr:nucleotidyltransferase domain-containing protein [Thermoanaerobacterales bacterium]
MPLTIEDAKERMIPVLKRHDVRRAAVFGSLARGEAGEESDVDLLV